MSRLKRSRKATAEYDKDHSLGKLRPTEAHPAAYEARAWLNNLSMEEFYKWREVFSSCAIEGNRLAQVCSETLSRMLNAQPVSDRYLLGLAWTLRAYTDVEDKRNIHGTKSQVDNNL